MQFSLNPLGPFAICLYLARVRAARLLFIDGLPLAHTQCTHAHRSPEEHHHHTRIAPVGDAGARARLACNAVRSIDIPTPYRSRSSVPASQIRRPFCFLSLSPRPSMVSGFRFWFRSMGRYLDIYLALSRTLLAVLLAVYGIPARPPNRKTHRTHSIESTRGEPRI